MKDGSEIEEGGDMIVAELRQMSDSNGDILDSFLKILIFLGRVCFLVKTIVDDVERKIEIGLWFVGNESDCLFNGLSALALRRVLVNAHNELVVSFR